MPSMDPALYNTVGSLAALYLVTVLVKMLTGFIKAARSTPDEAPQVVPPMGSGPIITERWLERIDDALRQVKQLHEWHKPDKAGRFTWDTAELGRIVAAQSAELSKLLAEVAAVRSELREMKRRGS